VLANLTSLRDRSRLATRNDGYASGVIDKLVSNIVGTGIKPLSLAPDVAFRKAAHELWLSWTAESDADGLLSWYGQQDQIVRCWLEAGEVFVRIRSRLPEDDLSVPMQVQVLEPELCPHTFNSGTSGMNRIRAGIEFDAIGKRVAYYFYQSRPGDLQDMDTTELRKIPAEQIIHLFKPRRAGQLRGIPHLTQALIRLRELDKFDDATLIRQQLAAMFVAFLEHPLTESSAVIPIVDQPNTTLEGDRPTLGLQPGIFQELGQGEKVTFSDPPDVISGYVDFTRQQLRAVSAATGVPYEVLTGDMSGVNDRTVRVILHEFRRQVIANQHEIVAFQLCRPVWEAWMDRAVLSSALPVDISAYIADPSDWLRVKWMPQGWPYIHPVQDVAAAQKAIRSGFTSRSEVVSEQGEDSEVVDQQQHDDNERADGLGLVYDSDPRRTSQIGIGQPDPSEQPQPRPAPGAPPPTEDDPVQQLLVTLRAPAPEVHVAAPEVHVAAPQVHVAAPEVHVAAPQVHVAAPTERPRRRSSVKLDWDETGKLIGGTLVPEGEK
jgi:lambda family phage portal protein